MKNTFLFAAIGILSYSTAIAQPNVRMDSSTKYSNSNSLNTNSVNLLNSISANKTDEQIARNYFDLAEALTKSGDFPKAEYYLNKAVETETGSKFKQNLPQYYRELARVQELENKNQIASANYLKASELSDDSLEKQLNKNDAIRLQQKSPQDQLQYLNTNGALLSNTTNNYEKLQNYSQLANTNIALNNTDVAMQNYRDALNTVDSNSETSILLKNNIVNLMVESNDIDHAVALQNNVVKLAKNNASVETQVVQLRNLSSLYFRIDSADAGLKLLLEAYNLALTKGNLKEAKKSLVELNSFYEKNGKSQEASKLNLDFISQLDNLLARDSSLIDRKLFLVNEGKIAELEQQQKLKDELIERKNTYNFVLIGSVALLSVLLLLIAKAWISIRTRNKQIALQSLRKEMNPHFIFNSLNSVNQFIANNNEREANKYLTSYSNLMRNIMENSNKDYVTLSVEIDQLKKYLELEKLRFSDKFEYELEIDSNINTDTVMVPNMILQPNLENAIWHGLRYKESRGLLKLKFHKNGNKTIATVDDNGIGLTESKKIKTKNQKLHESLGLKNVHERIRLLNDIYKSDICFELTEKKEGGVIAQLEW